MGWSNTTRFFHSSINLMSSPSPPPPQAPNSPIIPRPPMKTQRTTSYDLCNSGHYMRRLDLEDCELTFRANLLKRLQYESIIYEAKLKKKKNVNSTSINTVNKLFKKLSLKTSFKETSKKRVFKNTLKLTKAATAHTKVNNKDILMEASKDNSLS